MTEETASTAPVDPKDPVPAGTDLNSVRTVAEKWLASTMTLFGLLSFSAIFFGADTFKAFEGQEEWRAELFKLLLGSAVAFAALCTVFGTRAAHGWPPKFLFPTAEQKERVKNQKQRQGNDDAEERRSASEKINQARMDLKIAMGIAGLAVALILGTVILVFDTQLTESAPLTVEVFAPGEPANRLVCGVYATADEDGITVTKSDKSTDTRSWAEVGKVTAVRSC